jgi:hypothetical protein
MVAALLVLLAKRDRFTDDVAIIRPPGRAPIVVAICSIGSTSSADNCPAIVAEAARATLEFLAR